MPLRAKHPSERDLNRRSTLDPGSFWKRSEKAKSTDSLTATRSAVSSDTPRPSAHDVTRPSTSSSQRPPPLIQEPPFSSSTRRFSLARFRYASDSQLSAKAKEHAAREKTPPVPAVPSNPEPPAIITTAPTVVGSEQSQEATPKKRGRLQSFSLRRRSLDPSNFEHPKSLRQSMEKKRKPMGFKRSHGNLAEEIERPPTSQNWPENMMDSRLSSESASGLVPPAHRASESSRSDGSSGGHISFEQTPRPHPPPRSGSARFGFGRRKPRAPLFPLPPKVEQPRLPDTAPATPRVSISRLSSSSPRHSPPSTPPLTVRRVSQVAAGTQTPPLPTTSQVALVASALGFASPDSSALFRSESTRSLPKSIRSVRSSPHVAAPPRLGMRGRSSTMGSVSGFSDDNGTPTPPNGLVGRDSTSTAGRSSFSNLFGLSARFRQNPDLHTPRFGSPSPGLMASSGLSSHHNSFTISRESLVLPEREEGETPGHYLARIEANDVDKSVIASCLSKTGDAFLVSVLRSYMRRFAFFGDPMDMAIRKLLMQIELPKETQQIDRVLQGFADRYHECNPGIYSNTDKAYFISFSIIILHTDVFNKNNKRKMQRHDYIKNSSCEGVSSDVLGCFYDNIAYTPFIHIEDEVDFKNHNSKKSKRVAVLKSSMNEHQTKKVTKEPIDPYTLIFDGKLDILRPNIRDVMDLDDPYNYIGSVDALDTRNIYRLFGRYGIIQIVSSRSRPEAFMTEAAQENPLGTSVGLVEMPVTKVGILWRKDARRKKGRSPWQEWGAILTRSGLSLFRNASWAKNLMNQHEQHPERNKPSAVLFQPPLENFKQDHVIPMHGAIALVDNTYRKHKNSFIVFTKAGEETFLADNEKDLSEWLSLINYTAAFETLGVRSREVTDVLNEGQNNKEMQRHASTRFSKSASEATTNGTAQHSKIEDHFVQQMHNARKELMQIRISESEDRLAESIKELENLLRDARHLQILAPVQPKSRELVIHAAGRLAAKLKWTRIEIWRMKCHRDILAQELEFESRGSFGKLDGNSRVIESSHSQPSPQQANRSPKIGGLPRLASITSSVTGSHRPQTSPASSATRLAHKSSQDTDLGGEEAFKTPPEGSQNTSPNDTSVQFIVLPLSFNPPASDRRSSIASSARSPRLLPVNQRPSVSTVGADTADSNSDSDDDGRFITPPNERQPAEPRTPDIPSIDGMPWSPSADSEHEYSLTNPASSPASRNRQRRSLHRTLRDSHGGSVHRRSYRGGRDSVSTTVSNDTQDSERLTRDKGSFTLHGKKASVIQFGSDWHGTTAEEHLKNKKQLQDMHATASSTDDRDGNSIVSNRTVSARGTEPESNDDRTPRKFSTDKLKERHVSSQTITPATIQETRVVQGSGSDEASDMSDIIEESPTKERMPLDRSTKQKVVAV